MPTWDSANAVRTKRAEIRRGAAAAMARAGIGKKAIIERLRLPRRTLNRYLKDEQRG